MEFQPLKYIYEPTESPDASTLLLLHGTGGDEHDLVPLAKNFGNKFNILSVRGNVLEHGMPRFFKRLGMGVFDEKDLQFRTHELVSFLKELAPKEGFDSTKIIALGYSNGANIAGSMLFLYPDFLSGAILFRPMLPYKELPKSGTDNNVFVFISSGKLDPTVNTLETDVYSEALKERHFNLEVHSINTGHNLTKEDIILANDWLVTYFK